MYSGNLVLIRKKNVKKKHGSWKLPTLDKEKQTGQFLPFYEVRMYNFVITIFCF